MSTVEWRKVLWVRQGFPDNYIPQHAFLSALRKNPNFRPYTYWSLVFASYAVTQHLASIYIFLAVFVRVKERDLDPRVLVWISAACFLTGYVTWDVLNHDVFDGQLWRTNFAKTLKSSILIFLALLSLSPVLRTLTAATSSDSIWALAACLFILNIVFADYNPVQFAGRVREHLTSVLSMNAAISSSVVLASRLQDDLSVFALILFSVQVFALFPILRRRLQSAPIIFRSVLTFLISAYAVYLTAPISKIVARIYIFSLCVITFAAPGVLVWAQKYKNEIRGPWDVAVPKVN